MNGKKNIKILLVSCEGRIAGAQRSMLMLVRDICRSHMHIEVNVACPVMGDLYQNVSMYTNNIITISELPVKNLLKVLWFLYFLKLNFRILFFCKRHKIDIVHGNTIKAAIGCLLAKLSGKVKFVWHVRDLPKQSLSVFICGLFSDQIIAVSNFVKDRLPKKMRLKTVVIYNSTDQAGSDKQSKQAVKIFVNIGQFVSWKNQELFVEAARRYSMLNSESKFLMVGDDVFGRDEKYKKRLCRKLEDLKSHVNIEIVSWQKDLSILWREIDCLVHTAEFEPFGRVVIEAMANRVPVIVADAGGPGEIIEHGVGGLKFEPNNLEALVKQMELVSADEDISKYLIENAYRKCTENFNSEKCTNKILNVYKRLVAV